MVGKHFSKLFLPEDAINNKPYYELEEAKKFGKFRVENSWMVRKDKSRFWVSGTISALIKNSGELVGFVKIIRDLTDIKNYQEAIEKDKKN